MAGYSGCKGGCGYKAGGSSQGGISTPQQNSPLYDDSSIVKYEVPKPNAEYSTIPVLFYKADRV